MKQEADRKESSSSPTKNAKSTPTFSTLVKTKPKEVIDDVSNDKDDLFDIPRDDPEHLLVFEAANDDREDVVLTSMNSTMLHDGIEDLGSVE